MISKEERVTLHDRPFMPVRTVTERNRGDWLKEIDKITLEATAKTIPVSQVMGILSARGINIVSDLPLNDCIASSRSKPAQTTCAGSRSTPTPPNSPG